MAPDHPSTTCALATCCPYNPHVPHFVDWEPVPYLIERYSPPAIRAVWSDQHRFDLWLRIEILACEAWAALGRIPQTALPKIRQASICPSRLTPIPPGIRQLNGYDACDDVTRVRQTGGAMSEQLGGA